MPIYSSILPLIEANQWFTNGDHPEDHTINRINNGQVVKRLNPVEPTICSNCNQSTQFHGLLNPKLTNTSNELTVICPGDWIQTHRNAKQRITHYSLLNKTFFENYYTLHKEPV